MNTYSKHIHRNRVGCISCAHLALLSRIATHRGNVFQFECIARNSHSWRFETLLFGNSSIFEFSLCLVCTACVRYVNVNWGGGTHERVASSIELNMHIYLLLANWLFQYILNGGTYTIHMQLHAIYWWSECVISSAFCSNTPWAWDSLSQHLASTFIDW